LSTHHAKPDHTAQRDHANRTAVQARRQSSKQGELTGVGWSLVPACHATLPQCAAARQSRFEVAHPARYVPANSSRHSQHAQPAGTTSRHSQAITATLTDPRAHLVGKPKTKPSAASMVKGSATGTSPGLAGACILANTSAGSVSATCRLQAQYGQQECSVQHSGSGIPAEQ
jgi:hypothetical protein